ncbi:hypothetical protein D3C85_1553430 [compost metagenome]
MQRVREVGYRGLVWMRQVRLIVKAKCDGELAICMLNIEVANQVRIVAQAIWPDTGYERRGSFHNIAHRTDCPIAPV